MKILFCLSFFSLLFAGNNRLQPLQEQEPTSPALWQADRCGGELLYNKLVEFKQHKISWKQFKEFERQETKWMKDSCQESASGGKDEGQPDTNENGAEEKISGGNGMVEKVFFANYCGPRSVAMHVESGEWIFYETAHKKTKDGCEETGRHEIFRINAPISTEPEGSHVKLPALIDINEDFSGTKPLKFENFYWEWLNTTSGCHTMLGGWTAPECFYCENHPTLASSNIGEREQHCPNFMEYMEKLRPVSNDKFDFKVLVPCASNNKVYLVEQLSTKVSEVPHFEVNWFDSNYVKKNYTSNLAAWFDFIGNLSSIAARYPACEIVKTPTQNRLYAIVKTNINSRDIYVGAGIPKGKSASEIFTPVVASGGDNALDRTIEKSLFADKRFTALIVKRFEEDKIDTIKEVLPASWSQYSDPQQVVNNATSLPEFYTKLKEAIGPGIRMNLLIRDGNGDYSVAMQDGSTMPIKENSRFFTNPFYKLQSMLLIADPVLKEFTSNPDKQLSLFFFKGKDALWSWKNLGNGQIQQSSILSNRTTFSFTGESCASYLASLYDNAGEPEKKFFLTAAATGDNFTLSDLYSLENGHRIILYQTAQNLNAGYQLVERFSNVKNKDAYPPLKVFLVDKATLPEAYNDPIKRARLAVHFVRDSVATDGEVWLSKPYLGFHINRNISAYLACASFEEIPFSKILDCISPAYHLKKPTVPDRKLLFSNWLSNQWDTAVFRANPTGFLTRNQPIMKQF